MNWYAFLEIYQSNGLGKPMGARGDLVNDFESFGKFEKGDLWKF